MRGRYGIEIDGRNCFEKTTLVQDAGIDRFVSSIQGIADSSWT